MNVIVRPVKNGKSSSGWRMSCPCPAAELVAAMAATACSRAMTFVAQQHPRAKRRRAIAPRCASKSASHSSLSRSDREAGTRRAALWIKRCAIPSTKSHVRLEVIGPPGSDDYTSLCKNTATETCEDFARPPQSGWRQPIEPTPRPTRTRRIHGLPSTDKPSRGLEAKKDGIQGSGRELATLQQVSA